MRREEVYAGFWWGNLRERDYLEDSSRDGRIFGKFIYMAAYFAYAACSESGCKENQLDNTNKPFKQQQYADMMKQG